MNTNILEVGLHSKLVFYTASALSTHAPAVYVWIQPVFTRIHWGEVTLQGVLWQRAAWWTVLFWTDEPSYSLHVSCWRFLNVLLTLSGRKYESCVFLPERDYVTFGSLALFAIANPSACRLSVCNVRAPILRGLKLSAIFFHHCVPWSSFDLRAQFYGDRPRGTHPSGALNTRGLAK